VWRSGSVKSEGPVTLETALCARGDFVVYLVVIEAEHKIHCGNCDNFTSLEKILLPRYKPLRSV